jgi:hypothetical protein
MNENNTVDSILEALAKMAERKEPIDPHTWLEGVAKLLALLGNEQNTLFELEFVLAKVKSDAMHNGDTAAKAKIKAEARTEYLESRKLKAKIERAYEIVKVGKLMARMSQEEYKIQ